MQICTNLSTGSLFKMFLNTAQIHHVQLGIVGACWCHDVPCKQVETGSAVTWKYPSCVLKAANEALPEHALAVKESDTGRFKLTAFHS